MPERVSHSCKPSSPEKEVTTEHIITSKTCLHTLSLLPFAVPNVPNITTLARLSGTDGLLAWYPYTLDTSKGFLTKLEVSYLTVPVTSRGCPQSLDNAKTISVAVNESGYKFTQLQAEEEYCVAVKAWTAAGPGPSSEVMRLPRECISGVCVLGGGGGLLEEIR